MKIEKCGKDSCKMETDEVGKCGDEKQENDGGELPSTSTIVADDRLSFGRMVMKELRDCMWYWGAISATNACRLLRGRPAGTFLVRDSRSDNCIFSVSYVTEQGIFHSRLSRFNGLFCLGGPNALIHSPCLVDFVEQAIRSSTDANHSLRILMHNSPPTAAQMIEMRFPLRRSEFMPSLKYICRLVIRHTVHDAGANIDDLPLPKKLRKFVASPNYLLVC